jgi:hypothetical protein
MQRHGTHRDAVDAAFDGRLREALSEYARKQEAFAERAREFSRWSIDTEALTLVFERDEGGNLAFGIVPVATYLPGTGNWAWAWAWANDAFSEPAREKASRLKSLSEKTGYKIFTSPSFPVQAQEIDELCALPISKLNAVAVFKIKDEEPWLLVVIK